MNRKIILIYLILFPTFSYSQNEICEFVEKLQNYQKNVEVNDSLYPNIFIDKKTFNVAEYFNIFNKLSLKDNHYIDFLYIYAGGAATPRLYVYQDTLIFENRINNKIKELKLFWDSVALDCKMNKKIETNKSTHWGSDDLPDGWEFEIYLKEKNNVDRISAIKEMLFEDKSLEVINNIIPEKSVIGFFQYLIFYLFSDNFALYWHSNYLHRHLICSEKDLDLLTKRNRVRLDYDFNEDEINELRKFDLTPKLYLDEYECIITFYQFNINGFYRMKYEIRLQENLTVSLKEEELLVKNYMRIIY